MARLPAPAQRVIDATNSGDREAFLAAFAPDAVLVDWGKEFVGRDAIAGWDETDNIGRSSRIRVSSVEEEDGTWLAGVEVSGQGFNGTGFFRFTITGDSVRRMEITP